MCLPHDHVSLFVVHVTNTLPMYDAREALKRFELLRFLYDLFCFPEGVSQPGHLDGVRLEPFFLFSPATANNKTTFIVVA